MAGRCEYFWKENSAKFACKPRKLFKTCPSAARDTWNLCRSMALHESAPAPPAPGQGLHPSRAGRQCFSGGLQVAEDSSRHGSASWMPARSRSPGLLARATPCLRAHWLPLRRLRTGDTMRAFVNSRVAQHPVDPLGLGLGVLNRSESTGRPSQSGCHSSILYSLARPLPGGGGGQSPKNT